MTAATTKKPIYALLILALVVALSIPFQVRIEQDIAFLNTKAARFKSTYGT
jgi:hypothetical protein